MFSVAQIKDGIREILAEVKALRAEVAQMREEIKMARVRAAKENKPEV